MKQEQEFMRNKCFTFFESYLEGADKIKAQLGTEVGYNYLTGIIRYALYEEESEDPLVNALVSALKNTIDAGQDKREQGFNSTKENIDMTDKVLEYKKEHPKATQREIAEATGISLGKVNKALKKYKEEPSNLNDNNNDNVNNNSNLNNNSVNVNVNTSHDSPDELANAQTDAATQLPEKKRRLLKELSKEELLSLKDDFRRKIKYEVLYKKYNLAAYEIDDKLADRIDNILSERAKSEALEQINDGLTEDITSELLELTGQKTKNDLIKLLSEAKAKPQEALWFLKKRDYFTHENWIKYEECYKSTYPFFFVGGFEGNFDKDEYELDLEWDYAS